MAAIKLKFGFIPFPLAIVDEAADLSLGEYRLLGYLLRHQFRVKTDVVKLKQDELLHGVWKPHGRGRWDQGSGITSPRDLRAARMALEARGWLKVEATAAGMTFELCLAPEDEEDGADSDVDEGVDLGAQEPPAPSAKCTQENATERVQNAPDAECNLSTFRVQNALVAIRKEKVQEGSTRKNPLTPQGGISDLILEPLRESSNSNGNGERQKLPGESKGKAARVERMRRGLDASFDAIDTTAYHVERRRADAVLKVLRECGWSDPRGRGMTRTVRAAMDMHFSRSDGEQDWNGVAERMIAAYAEFLRCAHLMSSFRPGPRAFVRDGLWADDRKWPWDEKLVAARRGARVGSWAS